MSDLIKSLNFGHRLTPDGYFDKERTDEVMFEAANRIAELESELHYATNAGVIECMVRNKAVAERIAELEADNARLRVDGDKSKSLNKAVYKVLEGWTLPTDVRKILETAFFNDAAKEQS